jgi:hypothetical protein
MAGKTRRRGIWVDEDEVEEIVSLLRGYKRRYSGDARGDAATAE